MTEKLKVEYRDPKDLLKYEFNNKIHPKEQINEISKSIQEYGFNVPVIIDKDSVIIAGHGRVEASRKLGLKEIPVVVKNNLTDEQVRKYRLLDNKTAELGIIDTANILKELEDLDDQNLTNLFDSDFGNYDGEEVPDIDFDDIKSNEDRSVSDKTKEVECPHCGDKFSI